MIPGSLRSPAEGNSKESDTTDRLTKQTKQLGENKQIKPSKIKMAKKYSTIDYILLMNSKILQVRTKHQQQQDPHGIRNITRGGKGFGTALEPEQTEIKFPRSTTSHPLP